MSYFTQMLTAQSHNLLLPDGIKERAEKFILQGSAGATPERSPFRRMIDFWGFSIGVAVAKDLVPQPEGAAKSGRKFVDTRSVEVPDALCDLLAVIAFSELGDEHEDLDNPAAIIGVGNRFAATGCEEVLKVLEDPSFKVTTLERVLDFAAATLPN